MTVASVASTVVVLVNGRLRISRIVPINFYFKLSKRCPKLIKLRGFLPEVLILVRFSKLAQLLPSKVLALIYSFLTLLDFYGLSILSLWLH